MLSEFGGDNARFHKRKFSDVAHVRATIWEGPSNVKMQMRYRLVRWHSIVLPDRYTLWIAIKGYR